MQTYTYVSKGKLELIEKPKPVIMHERDAIVKVTLASICSSDLHIKHGSVPRAVPGITVGHEMVGIVEEVGGAVTHVKPGDRVTVNVETFCGECYFCKKGYVNNCIDRNGGWALGCRIDGGQAEYVRVPFADQGLNKIPDEVTERQALFVGDVLATGYWATRISEITEDAVETVYEVIDKDNVVMHRRKNLKELLDKNPEAISELSGSRSYTSQLISGKSAFGDKSARKIEEELGLKKGELDKDRELTEKITQEAQEKAIQAIKDKLESQPYNAVQQKLLDFLVQSNINLKELIENPYPSRDFVISLNDSMSPMIEKNDIVIMDNSITSYQGEGVYYFSLNNEMYIRYLKKNPYDQLIMKSTKDEFILEERILDKLMIKGRCNKVVKTLITEL